MDRKTLEKIKPLLAYGDIKAISNEGYTLTKTGVEKLVDEYMWCWLRLNHLEKVSRVELPIIQTNMEYWCEECKSLCATYEQGLSCSCDNRWETEVLDPKDYPKKWKKVKVNICSV